MVHADDAVLGEFRGKEGDIVAYPPSNMRISTDSSNNIRRMIELVEELDISAPQQKLEVIKIIFAEAPAVLSIVQEIYGIEAGGQYQLTERVELYGVLNYARGDEEDSEGNDEPADRMPPLNAKLGAIYTPTDNLRLEAYSLMADDQDRLSDRDEDDPRIDPNGTPGWGTINLALDWQALPATTVGFRVDNLGDRRYREHGSGIDAPGRSVGVWLRSGFSR